MGQPIIVWPPDGGQFTDYGDQNTQACIDALGTGYADCSDQYQYEVGDGLACCSQGF
jgi:hypothetical protein